MQVKKTQKSLLGLEKITGVANSLRYDFWELRLSIMYPPYVRTILILIHTYLYVPIKLFLSRGSCSRSRWADIIHMSTNVPACMRAPRLSLLVSGEAAPKTPRS